jgi:hypothetical protein
MDVSLFVVIIHLTPQENPPERLFWDFEMLRN